MQSYFSICLVVLTTFTSVVTCSDLECLVSYENLLVAECNVESPFHYVKEFYDTIVQIQNTSDPFKSYSLYVDEFCPSKLDLFQCFDEKIKPNLDIDCARMYNVQLDFLNYNKAILNYLCANNGYYIKEMLRDNVTSCVLDINNNEDCQMEDYEHVSDSRYVCRVCNTYIKCHSSYRACSKQNVIDIWINMHKAAQNELQCI